MGRLSRDVDLRPVEDQVIVVVGASSGIGLATARMAADRGARLVLAARSEAELEALVEEIEREGGDAISVVADVSDREDVREIRRVAEETYGGFDTWVNVASTFLYGTVEETPVEEMREQFETNVWGTVYGSLEAVDHLKDGGGALITIGSLASDRALIMQGSYSASKHAIKGFTDALRTELEREGAPVSVTLIKPAAIDTPYPRHAKNHMDRRATVPEPVYAPETVARAILHAAERPEREVTVGGGGKFLTLLDAVAPAVVDRLMETVFYRRQRTDEPPRPGTEPAIDGPAGDLEERGSYDGPVAEQSLYTKASTSDLVSHLATAALLVGVIALSYVWRVASGRD